MSDMKAIDRELVDIAREAFGKAAQGLEEDPIEASLRAVWPMAQEEMRAENRALREALIRARNHLDPMFYRETCETIDAALASASASGEGGERNLRHCVEHIAALVNDGYLSEAMSVVRTIELRPPRQLREMRRAGND